MTRRATAGPCNTAIGRAIKRARLGCGRKQKDVAVAAQMSAEYLCLIEKGQRAPSLSVLRRIAKAVNLKLSALIKMAESVSVTAKPGAWNGWRINGPE